MGRIKEAVTKVEEAKRTITLPKRRKIRKTRLSKQEAKIIKNGA